MKDVLKVYLFWIILLVVMVGIAGSYFVLVLPLNSQAVKITKELEADKKSLEKYQGRQIPNARWHEVARVYVDEMKAQETQCYDYIKKYKQFWDKPLREGVNADFDPDVFASIYQTERKEFLKRAQALVTLNGDPFKWPGTADSISEEASLNVQRYYWVLSEFLDVIVRGKIVQLNTVEIPTELRGEEDPEPYHVIEFKLNVTIVYENVPALVSSLLSTDNKFLCYIDEISMGRGGDKLPKLVPGQSLNEPPVSLDLKGKIYLFYLPPPEEDEEA